MNATSHQVAVVTGANRGIGQEISRKLSAAGLKVLRGAREPGAGDVLLDVTKPDQIDALAAQLVGGFDILVNNAAVYIDGFDVDVARRTLAVNFYGALDVTDRLLPRLKAGGRIVMVSSGMGELSHAGPALRARLDSPTLDRQGLLELIESFVQDVAAGVHTKNGWPSNAYSVSKLGLNALTRVLSRELATDPRSILINAACPGWVRTRMGGASAPRSVERGAETPVWLSLSPPGSKGGRFFRDKQSIPW
jgi:NAD(P)-dependent dehydrogenase (short-subunit alcohol dehydrogenase family)